MREQIIYQSNQQFMPEFITAVKALNRNKIMSLIMQQIKQVGKLIDIEADDIYIADLPIDGSNPATHYLLQQMNSANQDKIAECVEGLVKNGATITLKNKDQKNILDLIYLHAGSKTEIILQKLEFSVMDRDSFLIEKELARKRYEQTQSAKKMKIVDNNNSNSNSNSNDNKSSNARDQLFAAVMQDQDYTGFYQLGKTLGLLNNTVPFYSLVNEKKENALHIAVKLKKYEAIKSLMYIITQNFIDVKELGFITDANGNTPVDLALQNGDEFALMAMVEEIKPFHRKMFQEQLLVSRFLHAAKSCNPNLVIQHYNELVERKNINSDLIDIAINHVKDKDDSLRQLLLKAKQKFPYQPLNHNDYKPSIERIIETNQVHLLATVIKNINDLQAALDLAIKAKNDAVIEEIGKIVSTRSADEQILYLTRITDQNPKLDSEKKPKDEKASQKDAMSIDENRQALIPESKKEEKPQANNNNSFKPPVAPSNLIDLDNFVNNSNAVPEKITVNKNDHIKFYRNLNKMDAEVKLRKKQLVGNRMAYLIRYSADQNQIIISRLTPNAEYTHTTMENFVDPKYLNLSDKRQTGLLTDAVVELLDEGIKRYGEDFILDKSKHKYLRELFANTDFARVCLPSVILEPLKVPLANQPNSFFKQNAQPELKAEVAKPEPKVEIAKPEPKVEVKQLSEDEIPDDFICPISFDVMKDPVLCLLDNITYEKDEIVKWLKKNGTSPVDPNLKLNGPIDDKLLRPQYALKSLIARFCKDNPHLFEEKGPKPK